MACFSILGAMLAALAVVALFSFNHAPSTSASSSTGAPPSTLTFDAPTSQLDSSRGSGGSGSDDSSSSSANDEETWKSQAVDWNPGYEFSVKVAMRRIAGSKDGIEA